MKILTIAIALMTLSINKASTQTTADFESIQTGADGFLNGSDGSGGFPSGNIFLENQYTDDPQFPFWTGWAISSTTDTTTAGFTNQYSCIAGEGANGSQNYATTFVSGESRIVTTGAAAGGGLKGFYINNSTYAYYSMKDGDGFAKKFGGEDGTDPDFFYLEISNSDSGLPMTTVYLADYRFDDPEEDYILSEWTYVDLEAFTKVDTLSFRLFSSDNGMFGMNTPAYFCIDDFTTTDMVVSAIDVNQAEGISVYPNPTNGLLYLETEKQLNAYSCYNAMGQLCHYEDFNTNHKEIDITGLDQGVYTLVFHGENGLDTTARIIKR